MEKQNQIAKAHCLHYSNDKLVIEGVQNLCNYDEKQVEIALFGRALCITGEQLNVAKVDLDGGIVEVTGKIICIKYTGGKSQVSFFKRLLK